MRWEDASFSYCIGTSVIFVYDMIYLLTAIGLRPGTVHIYSQTIHRTTQSTQTLHRSTQLMNWEECGPCPVFASYTLAFALQLRKKHVVCSDDHYCSLNGRRTSSQMYSYILLPFCSIIWKTVTL